jgi:hypothetical protein
MNRRSFLKNTGLTAAMAGLPTIVPSTVFGKSAPSNRITIGMIGLGKAGIRPEPPGIKSRHHRVKDPGHTGNGRHPGNSCM